MADSWLKSFFLDEKPAGEQMVEARLGRTIGSVGYTGEKNLGELGPLKEYFPDYATLRARSWQLALDSEIAQTILGKYENYVVGKGLKLVCEPIKQILKSAKIKFDIQEFCEIMEAKFLGFSNSKRSDHAGMSTMNSLAKEAYKNAKIGGDVLVILRVDKDGNLTIQLVDGAHIQSPMYGTEYYPEKLANGNRIVNGVELNDKNQHVAYHVRKDEDSYDTERILARNPKNGRLMAYMVYGYKYRIDNVRGMPLMAVMFETMAKLERYKEAAVGGAEERQKIAFTVEHDLMSQGENPFAATTLRASDTNYGSGLIPVDDAGNQVADKVAVTTNKQAINMPRGSKLKMHESGMEMFYGDFYKTNFNFMCSALRIPPEVALSMFNANYSASRASLNDWGNTIEIEQADFGAQFVKPIYEMYAHLSIMKGDISLNDYVINFFANKLDIVEAILHCRFLGTIIKHIDPLKEVNAERMKLGILGGHIPLTTVEEVVERLGGGDSDANIEQFAEELKMALGFGVKPIEVQPATSQA